MLLFYIISNVFMVLSFNAIFRELYDRDHVPLLLELFQMLMAAKNDKGKGAGKLEGKCR